ncbi:MAG: alpha/beta fold hydrolase [Deltaproteobacteria bacterium]|nr:alpha/beta fold hydrolase [Deltaproteobacteria bacterium]
MEIDTSPFLLSGDARGVLLVHGFGGSPFAMRYLGEALHRRGMTVHGIRLAGHSGRAEDLASSRFPDWLASCDEGLRTLTAACAQASSAPTPPMIQVAGLSMGGVLALALALRRPDEIRGLALLATPLWLPALARWSLVLLRQLGLDTRTVPVPPRLGADVRDRGMRRRYPRTPAFPIPALRSLEALIGEVRPRLEEVRCPALVVHGRRDHTVPFACSTELVSRLPSARRLSLARSFHLVTIDVEKDLVAAEVGHFLAAQAPAATQEKTHG